MFDVRKTDAFQNWYDKLKSPQVRAKVLVRIRRLSLGNPGDVEPVGEGVSELRIHYGPGYRVYFVKKGSKVVILLGGGDKSTQKEDVAAAKDLARKLKE